MTVRDLFDDEELQNILRDNNLQLVEGNEGDDKVPPPPTVQYADGGPANVLNVQYINRLIKVGVPPVPLGDKADKLWVFSPKFLE